MTSMRHATWFVDTLATQTGEGEKYFWTATTQDNVSCHDLIQNSYSETREEALSQWEEFAEINGFEWWDQNDARYESELDAYLEATAK